VEVPASSSPEHRDERRLVALGDLADGGDPPFAQLLGGDRTDPPEPLDRERVEKGELAMGPSRPSGLATPLATLARNLVLATPTEIGRPTPSRTSRRSRAAISVAVPEIRSSPRTSRKALVDRESLDERRCLFEDLEHRLAGFGVGRHVR